MIKLERFGLETKTMAILFTIASMSEAGKQNDSTHPQKKTIKNCIKSCDCLIYKALMCKKKRVL